MSKADRLFEELGYEIDNDETLGIIDYYKPSLEHKFAEDKIQFDLINKGMTAFTVRGSQEFCLSLDYKELQAINEKVKELRMVRWYKWVKLKLENMWELIMEKYIKY